MKTILKVIMWVFLWPFLTPLWLWRKGKVGQILAGGWLLFLLLVVVSSMNSPSPPAGLAEPPLARQVFSTFTPTSAIVEQQTQNANLNDTSAQPIGIAANSVANLRDGPGTDYPIVGDVAEGQLLDIVARTAVGDWYQLSDGSWIAAFLVDNAPTVPEAVAPTDTPIPPIPLLVQPTETPISDRPAGAIANNGANLRGGPGTNFSVSGGVTVGQSLAIVARTAAGDWYQLEDGNWIAAFLVDNAPTVPEAANVPQQSPVSTLPATAPAQPSPGTLRIIAVNKGDEFVTVQNVGGQAVNMRGWTLISEKGPQSWTVPIDFVLQPGTTVRIHALSGQNDGANLYSGFGNEIWNNGERDPAVLYDPNGVEVSRF